jgi:hypothetical protein
MANNNITAQWHSDTLVKVYNNGLHVANVVQNKNHAGGKTWRTMYLGTGRRNGRKHFKFPSEAIQAFFGKHVQIQAAPAPAIILMPATRTTQAMDTLVSLAATLDEHKAEALKDGNDALYNALDIITHALNNAPDYPTRDGKLTITLDLTRK